MWWYDLFQTFAVAPGRNTGMMNRREFNSMIADEQFNLTMKKFIDAVNLNTSQEMTDAAATASGIIYPPKYNLAATDP